MYSVFPLCYEGGVALEGGLAQGVIQARTATECMQLLKYHHSDILFVNYFFKYSYLTICLLLNVL